MNKKIRVRTLLIGGIFTLLFSVLVARVYYVQVVEASKLVEEAELMWKTQKTLMAKRGTIFDTKMQILAKNAQAFTVAVSPQEIHNTGIASEVVKGLSAILRKPETELLEIVTRKGADGELLQQVEVRQEGWKISPEKAEQVRELIRELKEKKQIKNPWWNGLFLIEEERRYYPKDTLASNLLGYVDLEGKPNYGIESAYNNVLMGQSGTLLYESDKFGNRLPGSKVSMKPPMDGKDIVLTLDQNIQHYLDSALEKSYKDFKAKSVTGIAMDPKTGEILAMSNYPNFNPNTYWNIPDISVFSNHAITSQYEPGSTFKLVTLAGAVAEGIFDANAKFQSGSIRVPGGVIHDHNYSGWGQISYLEGLLRSSNVAFIKLGYEEMKEQKLRDYISRFGFGQKTGIDLPGEAKGLVQFYYPSEVASATFGQGGILASPLQLVSAYAAIANGGKLMEPHIVKKINDPVTGHTLEEHKPKMIREVVSPAVAKQVNELLEKVVSDPVGTGYRARIDGYRIAGKSGTADKVISGKYSEDGTYLISFIGYAPVEDPRIVIGIFVDQPDLGGNYQRGGETTLPAFKEAMSQSLHYLGLTPDRTELQRSKQAAGAQQPLQKPGAATVVIPDVAGKPVGEAKSAGAAAGAAVEVLGGGKTAVAQYPKQGSQMAAGARMYVLTEEKEKVQVPELRGHSMRDALELCSVLGLVCEVSGEGYVYSQEAAFGVRAGGGEASASESAVRKLRLELKPAGSWLNGGDAKRQ